VGRRIHLSPAASVLLGFIPLGAACHFDIGMYYQRAAAGVALTGDVPDADRE